MYSDPPLFKLYRKIGIMVRPAHFYGVVMNSVLMAPLIVRFLLGVYWLFSLHPPYHWLRGWGVWPYLGIALLIIVPTAFRITAQARAASIPKWSEV